MRAAVTFVLGTVIAYFLIFFGWIALADMFDFGDRDGGKIMSVAFAFAPAGAVVAGTTLAVVTRKRVAPSAEIR